MCQRLANVHLRPRSRKHYLMLMFVFCLTTRRTILSTSPLLSFIPIGYVRLCENHQFCEFPTSFFNLFFGKPLLKVHNCLRNLTYAQPVACHAQGRRVLAVDATTRTSTLPFPNCTPFIIPPRISRNHSKRLLQYDGKLRMREM